VNKLKFTNSSAQRVSLRTSWSASASEAGSLSRKVLAFKSAGWGPRRRRPSGAFAPSKARSPVISLGADLLFRSVELFFAHIRLHGGPAPLRNTS
jgi:hypothetical protein